MKRRILRSTVMLAVVVGAVTAARAQGRAPEFDAYLTLSNDYRSRGLSQLASGTSWQLGADYEHASGLFVGGVAANVDYAAESWREHPRDQVVNYYAGFGWGRRSWRLNFSLGRYVYPDASADYDYNELTFGATFMNGIFYNASYTDSFYALPYATWHHELGVAQPLRRNFELSIAVGQFGSNLPVRDYTHWNVGVSKVLRRIGLDLRFHETTLDAATPLGDPAGDRWVLSVSYGFPTRN